MPDPRMDYYESNDYATIKSNVLTYMDSIVEDLGLFPVSSSSELL